MPSSTHAQAGVARWALLPPAALSLATIAVSLAGVGAVRAVVLDVTAAVAVAVAADRDVAGVSEGVGAYPRQEGVVVVVAEDRADDFAVDVV